MTLAITFFGTAPKALPTEANITGTALTRRAASVSTIVEQDCDFYLPISSVAFDGNTYYLWEVDRSTETAWVFSPDSLTMMQVSWMDACCLGG
jgi:hypothetical protein